MSIQGRRMSAAELTRAKFEAKVQLLEAWARQGGAPPGQPYPRGPVALARWADPELGIEAWKSPNVASPGGPYKDLRSRYDESVRKLGRLAPGRSASWSTAMLAHLRAHNISLCEQVEEVRVAHQKDREEMDRLRSKLVVAEASAAELAAKLATVIPIRRA